MSASATYGVELGIFLAFLLLEPKVKKASTILSYETHVKYWFRIEGCAEGELNTPFLRQIRKGIKNTLPASPDGRQPLLLPLLMYNPTFRITNSVEHRILQFATIMGFIGMMRPHSLEELGPRSFRIVKASGKVKTMPKQPELFHEELVKSLRESTILGYYVVFRSKTMVGARAHFPDLSSARILS